MKHGPVEALITADEETGMFGANALPAGELQGDILFNLDSETWGKFVIGSAGGIDITASLNYKEVETDPEDAAVKITLKGLRGGHSGLEIHEGRANANKQLVRVVREAIEECEARLACWQGGNMRNAIPFKAEAVLTLPKENVEALKELVADWKEDLTDQFRHIETGVELIAEDVETPKMEVPVEIQDNLINAMYGCHDGVLRMIRSQFTRRHERLPRKDAGKLLQHGWHEGRDRRQLRRMGSQSRLRNPAPHAEGVPRAEWRGSHRGD